MNKQTPEGQNPFPLGSFTEADLKIQTLGPCQIDSPLKKLSASGRCPISFMEEEDRIVFDPRIKSIAAIHDAHKALPALESAGPRDKIYFDPANAKAAIVTCGGLCPGLNDVIRGIVMELYYRYGIKRIEGIPYGYHGFSLSDPTEPIHLTPDLVKAIHKQGGTILGSARGYPPTEEMVRYLAQKKIDMLFIIGGDGTLRGALDIADCAEAEGLKISIIGIPKTIDNDILYIDHSFGYETAFSKAAEAITSAHNEASSAKNGIGLVKVMGRNSGFIACAAAVAMNDVNFVLIPENPFQLKGPSGFLSALKDRLLARNHAVIVVAEGAGGDLTGGASSNSKEKDIGFFLKSAIESYFTDQKMSVTLKYIDPSYIIRSIPASAFDSIYCLALAQGAVHAAVSGRTRMVVGKRLQRIVHFPMEIIASGKQTVDLQGPLWKMVLSATGQSSCFWEE